MTLMTSSNVAILAESAIYAVILSTVALLLEPGAEHPIHQLAVAQLLSLAASNPIAFKAATATLASEDRDKLETSIRQGVAHRQAPTTSSVSAKPQISLKAFE